MNRTHAKYHNHVFRDYTGRFDGAFAASSNNHEHRRLRCLYGIHTNARLRLPSPSGASRWQGTGRRSPSQELSHELFLEMVTARVFSKLYFYLIVPIHH